MKIINFEPSYLETIVTLWNESLEPNSIFKKFTAESFTQKILNNNFYDNNLSIVLIEDNQIIGYGLAMYKDKLEDTPGFIPMITVHKDYQRKGLGTLILKELENRLKEFANKKFVREIFLSPVNLSWHIPQRGISDHPGIPAIPFNSPIYFLLVNNGYIINGQQQDAYYQDIQKYELPEKIVKINQKNESEGYYITYYDESKHYGFEELFKALNHVSWHDAVKNNLAKEEPNPMLVIVKDNKILGWTGPLFKEASGRGYFAGIGVHPECQGRGLGKSLFAELILRSQHNGSTFMSLFTGAENPARNIYLDAGFKIVQSFAVLRKELK